MPGRPRWAAASTAPTVPEYITESLRLAPQLTPESTRSGASSSNHSAMANITQSAGVPDTAKRRSPWW